MSVALTEAQEQAETNLRLAEEARDLANRLLALCELLYLEVLRATIGSAPPSKVDG